MVFLMKWTEPSPKRVLTPPGWRLRDPANSLPLVAVVIAAQLLARLAVAQRGSPGLQDWCPPRARRS